MRREDFRRFAPRPAPDKGLTALRRGGRQRRRLDRKRPAKGAHRFGRLGPNREYVVDLIERGPPGRKQVMGLVDEDPMGPPSASAQFGNRQEKARECGGPIGNGDGEHVDDDAVAGPLQHFEHFRQMGWRLGVALDDARAELRIIALWIEDADLEAVRENAFEQRHRQRGLAAARKPGDEPTPPCGWIITGRPSSRRPTSTALCSSTAPKVSTPRVMRLSISSLTPAPRAPRVTRSASSLIAGSALATATANPLACMKAWSFSASPTATTLWAERPRSSSAAFRPLALLTPAGRTITAPLLKTICNSSPRSRIASSTAFSLGSQVATMARPTDSGATPFARSRSTNPSGGSGARGCSFLVAGLK